VYQPEPNLPASSGIYAYQFDPMSGGISAVAGSPFAPNTAGGPLAMSRNAKFLYSINPTDGSLAAFSIQADGSLVSLPGAPSAGLSGDLLRAHPIADFLYATDASIGNVQVYAIDPSTGALTAQPADSTSYLGYPFVITPDGKHGYTIGAGVYGYSIDTATGALTALPGSPFPIQSGAWPGDATIDPSGRFMYVTYPGTSSGFALSGMTAFSIDPQTGAVSQITGYSPTVGPTGSVAVDASGKYAVIVAGVTSKTGPNCLAVASIDATSGTLSSVASSPFPSFNNNCGPLLADPSGSYIYSGPDSVAVYALDETTGVPQFVTDAALAGGLAVASLAVTH
jgi:6-phosphogluconolactonase (cycloisomerase 2 family)